MGETEGNRDVLGRTYEYCIAQFAEKEGKGGGEFYTPSSIVNTLVSILKPYSNCRVYDCCCGSGGMFVQSAKFIQAHSGNRGSISIYGQEANPDTWKMAIMNLTIRGLDADLGAYHADTFTNDLHPTLKADFILANPPFNYNPWGQDKLMDDVRWKYGIPPASNANFAWIQHMIHHLAPNGKIGLVLANGALSSQSGGEGEIRKKIIEDDLIEGIIAMPPQLFYSVTIPATLWFISKGKKQKGKTVFIDARKMGHMVDRKHPDYQGYDALSDVLASGRSSRLYRRLVMEKKLFTEIDSSITGDIEPGLFLLKGKLSPGISLEQGEEAIEMELRRMREELLEQRELDKVINRFESNDLFSNLHYLNKATNLAYYELLGGAENIDTEVEKYKKLTPFDLRRIAEKLFVPENSSTLWYKSVHAKREIITDVSD